MDLSKIKVIACDQDGVLTDGKLNMDHTGKKMFKTYHTRDVRAIRELIANGYEFYIVTADNWTGGKEFADKVGAQFVNMRDKSEVKKFLGDRPFICIGDDVWDVPMMKDAAKVFVPQDGYEFSRTEITGYTRLNTKGGHGVIAELLFHLITNQ